jgi:hypothetical protein
MSIVRVESKPKKIYLDGFFVFYQSFIPLAYISPGYFRNNAIPNLNSWIIHVFMKQERNHRKVWETSFKIKVIPALILFLKTYMYRIPHNIHCIFIFMFIHTNPMVILKSVCARVCVCDMGKKGKGLRKQSWDHRHLFHSKNICPLLFLTSR